MPQNDGADLLQRYRTEPQILRGLWRVKADRHRARRIERRNSPPILSRQAGSLRVNWTGAAGPERTLRTGLAFRIVDSLFVGAPHHFLGHRNRMHLMASKKQGNFP